MRRGEIVVVAQRGHYEGKPRPAIIIQSDAHLESHPSVLVCQLSTDPRAAIDAFFRVQVEPADTNGLRERSTIMIDRVVTIERVDRSARSVNAEPVEYSSRAVPRARIEGDLTRKRKLLDEQKEGKKKMRLPEASSRLSGIGKVDMPQEAFIAALRMGE